MKAAFLIVIFYLSVGSASSAQSISILKSDQLIESINQSSDTLYVVNFWATWCAPCVEELHIFNSKKLGEIYKPLKVILVSLDFKTQIDSKLTPFLSNRDIHEKVVWLDERNPNSWIDKIDSTWSGAIPATKVYYSGSQLFHEGELTSSELENMIHSIIK
ncbi:TlpA family protein disulfide reductase [Carboxylicivirga caseinilyticus]|uniref:TlpA family protein disulfide reductase n=1 Tax=Carboxylicivirga caseinilyticus TaxID=3417572 RepID=UPI003D33C009|nr:alkyl hydroperoxide reductase [Marinilabiliaceae bacterium A049]